MGHSTPSSSKSGLGKMQFIYEQNAIQEIICEQNEIYFRTNSETGRDDVTYSHKIFRYFSRILIFYWRVSENI